MKAKYLIIGIFILTIGTTSCDNWFDVSPKSDVKAEDLFTEESGFRDVLTGVYALMTTENLYGRQLTFGYVDVLAQYYNQITTSDHEYIKTLTFQYEEPYDKEVIRKMWSTQYKAISNLNTLLAYIDVNKAVFHSETIYRIYKGEAYALRAFLHFDLLRLFAPSPAMGKELKAIPYMDEYTNLAHPRLTVAGVLEKIIADLNAARELMRDVDSFGPEYATLFEEYQLDKQLKNRRYHLNYYAVTALLARIQLYAGNPQEALTAAQEIIGMPGDLPVTPFVLAAGTDTKDRLFEDEVAFGLEMNQLATIIDSYFGESAGKSSINFNPYLLNFTVVAKDRLFTPQNSADDDYRLKLWFKPAEGKTTMSNKLTEQQFIPLIRLSELYYIAAECAGGETGLAYLNKLRTYRGLVALTDASALENEIYKEYCKEFLNEGQMFYYYKRKNRSKMGVFKTVTVTPEQVYVLPLPIDEQDFGNKN